MRAVRSSRAAAARASAWQPAILVVGVVFLLVDLLLHGGVLRADLAAHGLSAVPRSPGVQSTALVLDRLGLRQTTVPPLVTAAVLLGRRTRSWRPLLLVSGALLGLNLVVGVLKLALARGEAVTGDPAFFVGGQAFPSGHSSNTALACTVMVHLVSRWRGRPVRRRTAALAVALPCLVMCAVSLFLGFHWLSDLVSGVLVGLLVAWVAVHLDGRLPTRPRPVVAQDPTSGGAGTGDVLAATGSVPCRLASRPSTGRPGRHAASTRASSAGRCTRTARPVRRPRPCRTRARR